MTQESSFDPVKFGRRFKTLRTISGIKQYDLSSQLGYTNNSQLSEVENGKGLLPINKLIEAANIMGIPAALFILEEDFTESQFQQLLLYIEAMTGKKIEPTTTPDRPRREPMGLSRRYAVLKRDGFQCVACGASGRDAQLEVDHIDSVATGGSNEMDNLQTLCHRCNVGKRDLL
jgi:transcriptional regulator with XRE-family HTH domain